MENSKHEKDLGLIKDLMEKSSKFSNLSGVADISTGILALLGASVIYFDIGISISEVHIYKLNWLTKEKEITNG